MFDMSAQHTKQPFSQSTKCSWGWWKHRDTNRWTNWNGIRWKLAKTKCTCFKSVSNGNSSVKDLFVKITNYDLLTAIRFTEPIKGVICKMFSQETCQRVLMLWHGKFGQPPIRSTSVWQPRTPIALVIYDIGQGKIFDLQLLYNSPTGIERGSILGISLAAQRIHRLLQMQWHFT